MASVRCWQMACLLASMLEGQAHAKHILVTGGIMRSHHLAIIPVVEELAKRGHRVVFALPNTDEFHGFFSDVIPGVEIKRVGKNDWSADAAFRFPDAKNLGWVQLAREYAAFLSTIQEGLRGPLLSMLPDLWRHVEEERPDVVLAHATSVSLLSTLSATPGSPPVAAVVTSLPAASQVLDDLDLMCRYPNIQSPDLLEDLERSLLLRVRNRLTCMVMGGVMDALFMQVDSMFAQEGLAPIESIARAIRMADVMVGYGGPPMMLPMPVPDLHLVGVVERAEPREVEATLRGWLDASLAAGAPVLYVSMGTKYEFTDKSGPEVVAALQGAMETLGVRVLWSLRKEQQARLRDLLPEQGASFRVEAFTPQPEVLAHDAVRAFLSHCGWGGVTDSLLAGVPVLGYPGFAEQFVNAVRVEETGAGLRVAPDFSGFARSLGRLLAEPSFASSAAASGRQLRELGGVERLADILEAAAEGRRLPRPPALEEAMSRVPPLLSTPQTLEAAICWAILLSAVALPLIPLLCCCLCCGRAMRGWLPPGLAPGPRLLGGSAQRKDKSA